MKHRKTAFIAISATCFWGLAQAAEFTVNDTADLPDVNPGDGICEATTDGSDCTLCGANEHVIAHMCVACPKGTTNAPGDDASGGDTECDE